MIAYTDFIEGLQKYSENCNTASTKCKLSLLIFDSTEYYRRYDNDYVSEHASNILQMFADSSDAVVPYIQHSQAHTHECINFVGL